MKDFRHPAENASTVVDENHNATRFLGKEAALLSAVEIGLGSFLHGFHIPFTGQFLSLNQIFLLSRAVARGRGIANRRFVPASISNISALLKSLSPAGKKLTPMLAISAQGTLYSLGTILFGTGRFGMFIGSLFSGIWAFAQPVLIYFLLFGKGLIQVGEYFYDKTSEAFSFEANDLLRVILILIGVKLFLSLVMVAIAISVSESRVQRYQDRMMKIASRRLGTGRRGESLSLWRKVSLSLRELFCPLFIISLAATLFFFWLAESSTSTLIWALLRPIAVGFILFFLIRIIPFETVAARMEGSAIQSFSRALREAMRVLLRSS